MINVDCKKLKEEGLNNLKEKTKGINITLKILQIEGDSASDLYIKNKIKASQLAGIKTDHILFDKNVTTDKILEIISKFNQDNKVNGIMLQLPVPEYIDQQKIINAIDPKKDVDGLTNENLGRIMTDTEGLRPCTAEGVLRLLDKIIGLHNLSSKRAVIIGRTSLISLPLVHMLLHYNVTPTICHTYTKNLQDLTKEADILITAMGGSPFIGASMIKKGAVIIDVSTTYDQQTGCLHGDVVYNEVVNKASYVTPVPGGVGQLTVLELMNNAYKAYQLQAKNLE